MKKDNKVNNKNSYNNNNSNNNNNRNAYNNNAHRDSPRTKQPGREWSYPLCACTQDCGECTMAYCYTPIYGGIAALRANEMPTALCFGGPVALRTKIRTERNIRGTICQDCCCMLWCPFCSLIQMSLEVRDTEPLI